MGELRLEEACGISQLVDSIETGVNMIWETGEVVVIVIAGSGRLVYDE